MFLEKSIDAPSSLWKRLSPGKAGRIPLALGHAVAVEESLTLEGRSKPSFAVRAAARDDIALAREIINDYGFSHAAEEAARHRSGRLPGSSTARRHREHRIHIRTQNTPPLTSGMKGKK